VMAQQPNLLYTFLLLVDSDEKVTAMISWKYSFPLLWIEIYEHRTKSKLYQLVYCCSWMHIIGATVTPRTTSSQQLTTFPIGYLIGYWMDSNFRQCMKLVIFWLVASECILFHSL
jgi:hypothetical protein